MEETNWDFNKAIFVFGELNKDHKIPAEAFNKWIRNENTILEIINKLIYNLQNWTMYIRDDEVDATQLKISFKISTL